jgi:hypothetical protein
MSFVSSSYVWVVVALAAFIGLFIIITIIRFVHFGCCLRSAIFTERNLKKYKSKSREAKVESDNIELDGICAGQGKKIVLDLDRCSSDASDLDQADKVKSEMRVADKSLSGGGNWWGGNWRVMDEVNRLEKVNKLNGRSSAKKRVSFSDDAGWNAFGGWFQKSEKDSEEERDGVWKKEGETKSDNESDFHKKAAKDTNKDIETSFFGLNDFWNTQNTRSNTADSGDDSDLEGNFRDACGDISEHEIVQDGLKKKLEQLLDQVEVVQQYRLK